MRGTAKGLMFFAWNRPNKKIIYSHEMGSAEDYVVCIKWAKQKDYCCLHENGPVQNG